MAGYKPCRSEVYSVQRNYLNVLDLKYYYPNEFEEELLEASKKTNDPEQKVNKLSDGQWNAMDTIYSNLTVESFEGDRDKGDIVVSNEPLRQGELLDQIKVLVPEGFRDVLSLST